MPTAIIKVTQATVRENITDSTGYVLLDLWAPWCVPCRNLAPVIDSISKLPDSELQVAKLDVEAHPEAMTQFGVRGIPTLILFHNGQEIGRQVGQKSFRELKAWLETQHVDLGEAKPLTAAVGDFASFYGDEELRQFFINRVMHHAAQQQIIARNYPYWDEKSGSISAAFTHCDSFTVFERVTGINATFAALLELIAPTEVHALQPITDALTAGKNYAPMPMRFIHAFFAEPSFAWPTLFADVNEAEQLRLVFVALLERYLRGRDIDDAQCQQLQRQAQALLHHQDVSVALVAAIIEQLATLPAASDFDSWNEVIGRLKTLIYDIGKHLSGWSAYDRNTEKRRFQWFMNKEQQSASGKLQGTELEAYRQQWQEENTEYQLKEAAFFADNFASMQPIYHRLHQLLTEALLHSPIYIAA